MEKIRILLTRHGETEWNAQWRIQGHSDMDLNERGVAQAEALASRLAGADVSVVYSSDLARASRTASIIQAKLDHGRHVISPLLRERDWGIFEGKKWEEIEDKLPDDIRELRSHPMDFKPEGGESRREVLERVEEFMGRLVEEHRGEMVTLVTHGGVCSLIVKYVAGMEMATISPFKIDNCSVSVIDYLESKFWLIRCLNDVSHLEDRKIV